VKPRRVSAVFWPLTAHSQAPSIPGLGPPQPHSHSLELLPTRPVLWHDWPRRQIRRNWLKVLAPKRWLWSWELRPRKNSTPLPGNRRLHERSVLIGGSVGMHASLAMLVPPRLHPSRSPSMAFQPRLPRSMDLLSSTLRNRCAPAFFSSLHQCGSP
jgi:hypothetical protein